MSSQSEILINTPEAMCGFNPVFPGKSMNTYDNEEISSMDGADVRRKLSLLTKLGLGRTSAASVPQSSMRQSSFIYEDRRSESIEEEQEEKERARTETMFGRCYSNDEDDFSINVFQKSADQVRQTYLNKLINMKILKLQPSKKHQEVIIFDWDDTLLPTSLICKHGMVNLPSAILENLKNLDEKVHHLLENAISFGQTYIISNGERKWINFSGSTYLPKSFKLIKQHIKIISARELYRNEFPEDSYRWKIEAFLDLKDKLDLNIITNIVSIGDSYMEMEAARCLGDELNDSIVKTVKFKANPGVNDLIKQIDLLEAKFEHIMTSKTNLTIRLERKN